MKSESLRVLHVVRSLEVGGLERVVCELATARGLETTRVACLTARGEFASLLEKCGGQVYDLSAPNCGRLNLLMNLVRIIQTYKPDVIHCHNMFAHAMGVLAATWAGCRPTVLTKHGTYFPRGWMRSYFHRSLLRRSHVVAVSTEIQEKMLSWAPFLTGCLSYIPNGIALPAVNRELSRRNTRVAMGWGEDEWIVISVSRIVPGKRLDLLLRAFEQMQRFRPLSRLVIVGDGPALDDLQRMANASSVAKSVCFLGQRMDISSLLCAADTFVLSSDNEGLPMAVLEAMANGIPVVATEVGEVPSVVEEGMTGYVVPPDSWELLAIAMTKLAESPQVAREMGLRGHERVESLFSVRTALRRYETIYYQLVEKKTR